MKDEPKGRENNSRRCIVPLVLTLIACALMQGLVQLQLLNPLLETLSATNLGAITSMNVPIDHHVDKQAVSTDSSATSREDVAKANEKKKKNLVAIAALGIPSAIGTVHYNVQHHFTGPDWDCIVFIYGNEDTVPPKDVRMKFVAKHCSIVRLEGLRWSHFLSTLTPTLTQHYDYIAVVLDDVFAPTEGSHAVNVTSLLLTLQQQQQQQDSNGNTDRDYYGSISPTVKGSAWSTTKPRSGRHKARTTNEETDASDIKCNIYQVEFIETFFQVFSRPLFDCFVSHLHYTNPHGFCIDLCLTRMCHSNHLYIDSDMTTYHLGMQYMIEKFIPPDAMVGANLTRTMRRPIAPYEVDYALCHQYKCPYNKTELNQMKGINQCDIN